MKKVYVIWIWWIWISGIARYYLEKWYQVFWSDKTESELIHTMQKEWIQIIIWEDENRIDKSFEKIIYTEAIPKTQIELQKALKLWINILTYPESLAEIANKKKLITIAWTHWKSTTTSMTSLILKNSKLNVNALVGSLLKEFDGKNVYFSESEYFVLEACEYKRSFLRYKPYIWVITNIDLDHLDYYKDLPDYISAFESYVKNIVPWGYLIINWNEENSMKLVWIRDDINYVLVWKNEFEINSKNPLNPPYQGEICSHYNSSPDKGRLGGVFPNNSSPDKGRLGGVSPNSPPAGEELEGGLFPTFDLKIPWEHILFDAKLAFVVWKIVWLNNNEIINTLNEYNGIWRRSEIIWTTKNWNILMSDYGHHPTEISLNLKALKGKYQPSPLAPLPWDRGEYRKLLTVFQPHQYNRTLELLEDFKNCFSDTDILIIPDIYESRDSEEDKAKINAEKLINYINHPHKIFGNWFKNTLKLIQEFDEKNPQQLVIILQWAWNIDDLRYEIEFN